MQPLRRVLMLLLLGAVLSGCSSMASVSHPVPTPTLSSPARAYLTTALDDMQNNSINSKKINWTRLRQEAFVNANGAQTPKDTYLAIRLALSELGDHHSIFWNPQAAQQLVNNNVTSDETSHAQLVEHGIGYLMLPHFEGSNSAAQQYAMLTQNAISTVDHAGTCGWVVDLRNNTGGNMWPMLAGVGPILGDGTIGAFVDARNNKTFWGYYGGNSQVGGNIIVKVKNAYQMKRPLPPVAVLTNHDTASSGEAIVVAFRNRPHTRSFGEPTSGVPTANQIFSLSDGALLIVTAALDADRTGQTYNSPIIPDQGVSANVSPIGTSGDTAIQAATNWLHNQEGC